jgi:hypothetical protein
MKPTEIALRYAEMMDKLRSPDDWDVPGIIAETAQDLMNCDNPEAAAVIDTLTFRVRDIAERISHKHASRIDPGTLREAANIADVFVRAD